MFLAGFHEILHLRVSSGRCLKFVGPKNDGCSPLKTTYPRVISHTNSYKSTSVVMEIPIRMPQLMIYVFLKKMYLSYLAVLNCRYQLLISTIQLSPTPQPTTNHPPPLPERGRALPQQWDLPSPAHPSSQARHALGTGNGAKRLCNSLDLLAGPMAPKKHEDMRIMNDIGIIWRFYAVSVGFEWGTRINIEHSLDWFGEKTDPLIR